MHGDIQKGRLLVISDTAMYRDGKSIRGFEPVVRELEALQTSFSEIVWLGCRISGRPTALRKPSGLNIKMVVMPATSHKYLNAFFVLLSYPVFLFYILRYLPGSTHVHTRAPSHPAIIGILISFFDRKRIYWHKYAGDWTIPSAPYTYRLQRKWLKALHYPNIRVTVNGKWSGDPAHVYAFENPCYYEKEQDEAFLQASQKQFGGKLSLLFVGNVNEHKGILNLISALEQYEIPTVFSGLYIVGNGPLYDEVKVRSEKIKKINIMLTGHINRNTINEYYKKSHFIILPSKSEGFPKVIAEAAAYGCIPVVTDVSSLSQYIDDGINGYLLPDNSAETIARKLTDIIQRNNFDCISRSATKLSVKFTYEYFVNRLQKEIF